jgi:hypothetical protein
VVTLRCKAEALGALIADHTQHILSLLHFHVRTALTHIITYPLIFALAELRAGTLRCKPEALAALMGDHTQLDCTVLHDIMQTVCCIGAVSLSLQS